MKTSTLLTILFLFSALSLSGCGLLGIGGGDSDEEIPEEAAAELVAPSISETTAGYATRRQFFEVRKDVTAIKTELARIKSDINAYSKTPKSVRGVEAGYGFLESYEITHKVTLNNGTEVFGKITRETLDTVILVTQIGTLTIDRRQIRDIAPAEAPRAECQIVGDVGSLETRVYKDRRVYSGFVTNVGERRADFVLVKIKLAQENTRIIAVDSAYVDGNNFKFRTGVISDTSIEPDERVPFSVTVYLPPDPEIAYYTADVLWKEYD